MHPTNTLFYSDALYYDSNVWVDAGSPVGPVKLNIQISSSTVLGSTDPLIPAMDFSDFDAGSALYLFNFGLIQPKGGFGGGTYLANGAQDSPWRCTGSGGGGAGTDGGEPGWIPITTAEVTWFVPLNAQGVQGTSLLGGAGGISPGVPGFDKSIPPDRTNYLYKIVAGDGGDAILLGDASVTILNIDGDIWAGGGGGGTGGLALIEPGPLGWNDGWTGGAPAQPGEEHPNLFFPSGAPGKAIRYGGAGSAIFINGGTPPNVLGIIGGG